MTVIRQYTINSSSSLRILYYFIRPTATSRLNWVQFNTESMPQKLSMDDDAGRPDPQFGRYASRRSVVYSAKGMIACSQPLAAEAGLEILRRGGNAADAAVAVSAALSLVEPCSCGIGGDAFCLYYDNKTKSVKALNGSGRAPQALTLDKCKELGLKGKDIPLLDINSVTVPGCAAAWVDTIEKLGSGKISVADALEPAIRLTEEGAPISEVSSYYWRRGESRFLKQSKDGKDMLIPNGEGKKPGFHAPGPGEVFRNPMLAKTFKAVAQHGKKGFYEGEVAQAIVDLIKSKGGVMTLEDLASHTTTVVDPISYNYRGTQGVTLWECPPNGQGITALIALGIIEQLEETGVIDFSTMEHNGVEWLHTLIEALRLAFADTRAYVADPDKVEVPVKELLSKSYLQKRAALFNPKKVNSNIKRGVPFASSDTVLFTTADSEGNACSYIQSNYAGFGTFAVPKGCGFTLQNRGSNFTLDESHPNCVAGGKRPYHTIIPAIVTRGNGSCGELFMTYGVMGGFMQPQGHVQVLFNMIHKGMNAQEALDAPRFCISAGTPDNIETSGKEDPSNAGDIDSTVNLEDGIPVQVKDALAKMGHDVVILTGHARGTFGKGQVIQKLLGGAWAGGSDLRGDGHAVPQI